MANVVRLVACLAILIGLLGELSFGLLLPSRIQVRYVSPPARYAVYVDLPALQQAVPWCNEAMTPDQSGRQVNCDFLPSR